MMQGIIRMTTQIALIHQKEKMSLKAEQMKLFQSRWETDLIRKILHYLGKTGLAKKAMKNLNIGKIVMPEVNTVRTKEANSKVEKMPSLTMIQVRNQIMDLNNHLSMNLFMKQLTKMVSQLHFQEEPYKGLYIYCRYH